MAAIDGVDMVGIQAQVDGFCRNTRMKANLAGMPMYVSKRSCTLVNWVDYANELTSDLMFQTIAGALPVIADEQQRNAVEAAVRARCGDFAVNIIREGLNNDVDTMIRQKKAQRLPTEPLTMANEIRGAYNLKQLTPDLRNRANLQITINTFLSASRNVKADRSG